MKLLVSSESLLPILTGAFNAELGFWSSLHMGQVEATLVKSFAS